MESRILEIKSSFDKTRELLKSEKAYIRKEYLKAQGTELVTKTGCSSCWSDAIAIIIHSYSANKIQMKGGALVYFNNVIYTKLNITDAIARQIIASQPENAHFFSNY